MSKFKVISNERLLEALTIHLRALSAIDDDTEVVKCIRVPEGWDIKVEKNKND